jgi:glutaredoxin 3
LPVSAEIIRFVQDDKNKMVKVYSTPTCPYCVTLKNFLKEKGVEFEDIDVSQDQKELDGMIEKSGQLGVPVADIDGQIVVGFDKAKICELLKIEG